MNIDNSCEISTNISRLYSEGLLCDIIIVVGATEYPAHRLIMCASSDVFQAMFSNPLWIESVKNRIVLKETTPACASVFKDFLRYLYTGKIQFDFCNMLPLVILSDKYNVKSLLKIGLQFMMDNMGIACKKNQLVSWLQFSMASGQKQLEEECLNFTKWNFNVVSNATDFSSIEPDLMILLLESHEIVIHDEFELFVCLLRWIEGRQEMIISKEEKDVCEMEEYFNTIITYIRFPMMSP